MRAAVHTQANASHLFRSHLKQGQEDSIFLDRTATREGKGAYVPKVKRRAVSCGIYYPHSTLDKFDTRAASTVLHAKPGSIENRIRYLLAVCGILTSRGTIVRHLQTLHITALECFFSASDAHDTHQLLPEEGLVLVLVHLLKTDDGRPELQNLSKVWATSTTREKNHDQSRPACMRAVGLRRSVKESDRYRQTGVIARAVVYTFARPASALQRAVLAWVTAGGKANLVVQPALKQSNCSAKPGGGCARGSAATVGESPHLTLSGRDTHTLYCTDKLLGAGTM